MAGSFGYEEEHFQISQQIGELVLFPAVRSAPAETSSPPRHQLPPPGQGRHRPVAQHPVEILHAALI
jgi:hypothetical protein